MTDQQKLLAKLSKCLAHKYITMSQYLDCIKELSNERGIERANTLLNITLAKPVVEEHLKQMKASA